MYEDFVKQYIAIPFYANLNTDSIGLDSRAQCFDSKRFARHAQVHYQFNEIGFRTHPIDQFQHDAILLLGDSFTLGLGNHAQDRFGDVLEQTVSHQVLNFSLNGASNDWIARKLQQLLQVFTPKSIVIHYTFSHRRERPYEDWQDHERTECEPFYSSQENYENWYKNFQSICDSAGNIPLIHSFIHNWHDQAIDYSTLGKNVIAPLTPVDLARDGFHYGPETHRLLVREITNLLVLE